MAADIGSTFVCPAFSPCASKERKDQANLLVKLCKCTKISWSCHLCAEGVEMVHCCKMGTAVFDPRKLGS